MVNGVRHESNLEHTQLTVHLNSQATCRSRQMFVINGISDDCRTLKINDPNLNTLKTALLERVFYHNVDGVYQLIVEPDESHVFKTLSGFRRQLVIKLGSSSPVSPEQFAEMYTGRKRTIYDQAVVDFTTHGVRRRDAYSDSFVKCEKVPSNKAPRCIQPRRPVYNVGVGRYLKPVEHRIYQAIQFVFGSETPVVVKGFNAVQTADILNKKFNRFEKPVALGLDASRFDQHVSPQMLKWEHSIYNSIFKSAELRKLLRWQVDNIGFGRCDDGWLEYKVQGKRFSGDMNTALGNCLIMCAMIYAYAKERGVDVELANNGDDCVVFMEAEHLNKFSHGLDEWFDQLGFVMTKEVPVYELHEVEFCQSKPVYGSHGLVMCRGFMKSREKDSICLFDITNSKAASKWLGAVGECGLAIASGVPVLQEMYNSFVRAGTPSKLTKSVGWQCGMTMMAKGLHSRYEEITADARYSFFVAFGITPDEQVALEEYYRSWKYSDDVAWDADLSDILAAPF